MAEIFALCTARANKTLNDGFTEWLDKCKERGIDSHPRSLCRETIDSLLEKLV